MKDKKNIIMKKKRECIAATVIFNAVGIIALFSIPMMGVGLFAKPNKASFITGAVGFVMSSLVLLAVIAFCVAVAYDCLSDLKKVNGELEDIDSLEQEPSQGLPSV